MIIKLITLNTEPIDELRAIRNRLLSASDWTQLPDAQCDKTAWATYRQALRDFPATWKESDTANFPEAPA